MEAVRMNELELRKYANVRGLNLGQAEKDYFQNMALFVLYSRVSKELVFKGGTALAKCYGLNRFSEDLDFTASQWLDFTDYVGKGLDEFNLAHSMKEAKASPNSKKFKVKIEGPLYKQSEKTLCSLTLDFSLREKVLMEPDSVTIGLHMDVIPVFDVYVMKKEEIMAEKIRALFSRESARDLYDLVFLIRGGAIADKKIVGEKLEFIQTSFDEKKLMNRCRQLEGIWASELKSLVRTAPDFNQYLSEVKRFSWIR
ncbi:nucleotidyl transferase AbiEii/AbiGii toxin family protein [Candidatus Micrarchaeota archaeon]|nr:nucleotidyl transferase AbiEii/AbiGii toxin family protein [Candidatus Micrarchaeota archaeon]